MDRSNSRYSTRLRTLATLLSALLALGPGGAALAAPARTPLVALPYSPLPGAPDAFALRVSAQVFSELTQRTTLKLVDAPASREAIPTTEKLKADAEKARANVAQQMMKASDLSKKGKSKQAAQLLQKTLAQFTAQPFAIDEAGGKLLGDLLLQLAAARTLSGDDSGADATLNEFVTRAPDRTVAAGSYPPAFVHAIEAARQRTLSNVRATVRILGQQGAPAARVLLDGRPLGNAPLLLTDALPGAHALRVEGADSAWADSVVLVAGAELSVMPRLGAPGTPEQELAGALGQGRIDRATASRAARLAKAANAQATLVGTIAREGDGFTVRSALVLARNEKVIALAPLTLDAEMLSASLEVLRLVDDLVAKLAASPDGAALPLAMGGAVSDGAELPTAVAAPPPPESAVGLPKAAEIAAAAGAGSKELPLPEASETPAEHLDADALPVRRAVVPSAVAAPESTTKEAAVALAVAPPAPVAAVAPAPVAAPAPAPIAVTKPAAAPPAVKLSTPPEPKAAAPAAKVAAAAPTPAPALTAARPTPPAPEPAPAQPIAPESEPASPTAERRVFVPGSTPPPELPSPARTAPAPSKAESVPATTEAAPLASKNIKTDTQPEAAQSRDLFVPRKATQREDEEQQVAEVVEPPASTAAPFAATRVEAREANEIATIRDEQPAKDHTVLWIVAGALLVGGAAIAGGVVYANSRTATISNVSLTWSH